MTKDEAWQLRRLLERQTDSMDDDTILDFPAFVEQWQTATAYEAGKRLYYDGTLYKVLQAHTSQDDWTPDAATSLFAKVLAGQDGTDIGEWVQPDSTNPYSKGDKVTHNGKTWESLIDNNVWEPGATGTEALWSEVSS